MLFFIIARLVDDFVAMAGQAVVRRRAAFVENSPIFARFSHVSHAHQMRGGTALLPAGR
jgi:hypothetical protein